MSEKRCPKCNQNKLLQDFFKSKRLKDGYSCWCRQCNRERNKKDYYKNHDQTKANNRAYREKHKDREREYAKKYYHKDKLKQRNYHLKKEYGITQKDYEMMLNYQQHKCAICHDKLGEKLFVDHNHKTEEIRGLLCNSCNALIGYAKENPDILNSAIDYLTDYPAQFLPIKKAEPCLI